jgi:hypothetical protein
MARAAASLCIRTAHLVLRAELGLRDRPRVRAADRRDHDARAFEIRLLRGLGLLLAPAHDLRLFHGNLHLASAGFRLSLSMWRPTRDCSAVICASGTVESCAIGLLWRVVRFTTRPLFSSRSHARPS